MIFEIYNLNFKEVWSNVADFIFHSSAHFSKIVNNILNLLIFFLENWLNWLPVLSFFKKLTPKFALFSRITHVFWIKFSAASYNHNLQTGTIYNWDCIFWVEFQFFSRFWQYTLTFSLLKYGSGVIKVGSCKNEHPTRDFDHFIIFTISTASFWQLSFQVFYSQDSLVIHLLIFGITLSLKLRRSSWTHLLISSTSSFRIWAARQDGVSLASSLANQPNDGAAEIYLN